MKCKEDRGASGSRGVAGMPAEETSALGTEREDILGGTAWPGAEHLWCSSGPPGVLLVGGAVSILLGALYSSRARPAALWNDCHFPFPF